MTDQHLNIIGPVTNCACAMLLSPTLTHVNYAENCAENSPGFILYLKICGYQMVKIAMFSAQKPAAILHM
jgi:hypothetical protein